MPLLRKVVAFANSPQGKRLLAEAQRRAQDPRTQEQVKSVARRLLSSRQKGR